MRRFACAIIYTLVGVCAVSLAACSSGGSHTADAPPGPPDAIVIPDAMLPDAGAQAFGDPCNKLDDCSSGYCVEKAGGDGGVCSRQCSNDCPTGWDCKSVTLSGGNMVDLCVPESSILCARCTADDQCPGGDCLSIDSEQRCASTCTLPTDCPQGYQCNPDASGTHTGKFCQPVTASCSCSQGMSGASRSCSNSNAIGTCLGTQTCDPATGWSACNARTPATETCNGVDDDCNFVIDDGVGGGQACNITNGFGTCQGVNTCEGASGFQCIGQTPAMELCNFLDDDCDGKVDENFPDLGTLCQAGVGACLHYGSMQCSATGTSTQCSAVAGTPSAEMCNNVDDDCDGKVDEDFPTLGQGCTAGQGVCTRQGTIVCDGAGDAAVCSAMPGPPTGAETCNYVDDDCDGVIDNGFRDANGVYNQAQHCGTCSIDCTQVYAGAANASGVCHVQGTNASCALSCNAGAFDLNGQSADGCEFVLDATAIYVSGSDAAAVDDGTCGIGPVGTGAGNHPCKTITFGLSRATSTGRANVYVADGTYDEAVTMIDGKNLYGGYRADNWERHLATTASVIQGVSTAGVHDRTVIATNLAQATVFEGFVVRGSANAKPSGNSYAIYVSGTGSNLQIRSNQVFAGRGGPGAVGGAGVNGTAGGNGAVYSTALDSITASAGQCNVAKNRPASGGATLSCSGTAVNGGNGGGNNCSPLRSTQTSTGTYPAVNGNAGGGAGGGTGGAAGVRGYDAELNANTCYVPVSGTTQLPQFGADGKDGGNGGPAGGVAGCSAVTGSVVGGNWVGTTAPLGTVGSNGGGGGGGAAGGGSHCDTGLGTCSSDMLGGHGGGGATGGCGGSGGGGGGPGGGAFAIFIVGSTAPVVTNNTITLGDGGQGGDGGIGGAGGLGGVGGGGGQVGALFCTGKGGRGGDGGNGGAGGGGGGGCGGLSIGVYTSGFTTANYCTTAGNTFSGGQGGPAGPGGFSGGNSGGSGTVGSLSNCSLNP